MTHSNSGAMRPHLNGEVKPISVSASAEYAGKGAGLAIDGNMATEAHFHKGSYSNAWFKATLSSGYCIQTVLNYWGSALSLVDTRHCSSGGCSCSGGQCGRWSLQVFYADGRSPNYSGLPSGCKLGDTIYFQTISSSDSMDFDDLAIIQICKYLV